MTTLAEAATARKERLLFEELDKRLDLLLAGTGKESPGDRYHAVTANPRSMGYLRFLLKHYAKSPTPWRDCYKDNFRRFGPKAKGLCGVLKDTIRQHASWRGHPALDVGAPGVAIGEADKGAAPAWGGHHLSDERPLSLLDELDMEFGVVDHTEALTEAAQIFCAIGEKCDVYRVLIGLDEAPALNLAEVLA